MSDTTDFCPHCGTNLEPDATVCPGCGARWDESGTFVPVKKPFETYKWLVVGGVAIVAVAAYFVFSGMFGPSGEEICTATLNQARSFGVISPSATLASTSAESTDIKDRKSCTAQVGAETYKLVVDIKKRDEKNKKCRDYIKQLSCVALYSAARSDGMTTYQVREIPPEETDEALAKEGLLGMPPAADAGAQHGADANTAPDQAGGMFDTESAVGSPTATQSAPAPETQAQ